MRRARSRSCADVATSCRRTSPSSRPTSCATGRAQLRVSRRGADGPTRSSTRCSAPSAMPRIDLARRQRDARLAALAPPRGRRCARARERCRSTAARVDLTRAPAARRHASRATTARPPSGRRPSSPRSGPYEPGDDARRIDWNVTARTGEPHIRVDVAERALTTWLVLDVSPSMLFGTADRRKADVAEGVALAAAQSRGARAARSASRPSAGLARPRPADPGPALHGARCSRRCAPSRPTAAARAVARRRGPPRVTLAAARSLLVVVSDFRGARDLARRPSRGPRPPRPPRRRDSRPARAGAAGRRNLHPGRSRDGPPDSRRHAHRRLRARFAERAARSAASFAAELRSCRADHVRALDLRRLAAALWPSPCGAATGADDDLRTGLSPCSACRRATGAARVRDRPAAALEVRAALHEPRPARERGRRVAWLAPARPGRRLPRGPRRARDRGCRDRR